MSEEAQSAVEARLLDRIQGVAQDLAALSDEYHQTDARAHPLRELAAAALAEVKRLVEEAVAIGERIWPNPGVAAKKK